jgi:hypothetical protein
MQSLSGVVTTLREINKSLGTDQELEVKIKAIDGGSFDVGLVICSVWQQAQGLFNKDNVNSASQVVNTLAGLYRLKQMLGGEEPKEVKEEADQVKIVSPNGTVNYFEKPVFNIYSHNQKASDAIAQTFGAIQKDSTVKELKLIDKDGKEFFQAEKQDFQELASQIEAPDLKKKTEVERVTLTLHKLVLEPGFKWDFLHNGVKLSASIKDQDFYKKISSRELSFSSGDSIEVDLEIHKIFDEDAKVFINHSYVIKKVHKLNKRSEQTEIPGKEEQ